MSDNKQNNMGFFDIASLALGAGSSAVGAIGERARNRRFFDQQQQLMQKQFQNQQELNKQGQALAMQTWKATSYPAQVAMMKEAGLNPALMYGSSGPGGSTASGSGGSASGGSPAQPGSMGIETQAMLQGAKLASEIAVNKSIAKKNEAEAEYTGGVGTEKASQEILNLQQGVKTEQARARVLEVEADLKAWQSRHLEGTFKSAVRYAKTEADTLEQEYRSAVAKADVDEATINDNIRQIRANVANTVVDTKLKESGIAVNLSQRKYMAAQIVQGYERLRIENKKVFTQEDVQKMQQRLGNESLDIQWFNSITGVLSDILSVAKPKFGGY